jgi:hypothetical protein
MSPIKNKIELTISLLFYRKSYEASLSFGCLLWSACDVMIRTKSKCDCQSV